VYLERPLASFPIDHATDLVTALFAIDGPLGRALVRQASGDPDPVTAARRELDRAIAGVRGAFADAMVVGRSRAGGFEAAAIYALSPLTGHPLARRLTGAIGAPCRARFAAPYGLVHAIALRDPGDLGAHAAIVSHVAHRALARLYGAVFVCALDRGTAGVYRRFGLEFPAELASVGPAVGVLEPSLPSSLAILRALDQGHDLAA